MSGRRARCDAATSGNVVKSDRLCPGSFQRPRKTNEDGIHADV